MFSPPFFVCHSRRDVTYATKKTWGVSIETGSFSFSQCWVRNPTGWAAYNERISEEEGESKKAPLLKELAQWLVGQLREERDGEKGFCLKYATPFTLPRVQPTAHPFFFHAGGGRWCPSPSRELSSWLWVSPRSAGHKFRKYRIRAKEEEEGKASRWADSS